MNTRTPDSRRNLSPLARAAREGDYDRFLVALFAPPERRETLFALIALNLELARIRDAVREPMLGQIRLQWWREAVAEAHAGKPRNHDVLRGLAAANPPAELVSELIDAREVEYEPQGPSFEQFRSYVHGTSGALAEAMAAVSGADETTRNAARRVGTAFGLVGTLRATRFHARHGRVLLPSDLLDEAGTSAAAMKELRSEPGLARAAERIASMARGELTEARAQRSAIDRGQRHAMLLAPLTDAYLRRLDAARFDLLGSDFPLAPLRRQLTVGWAAIRGTF